MPQDDETKPDSNEEAENMAAPLVQEMPLGVQEEVELDEAHGQALQNFVPIDFNLLALELGINQGHAHVNEHNLEGNDENVHPDQADENLIQPENLEVNQQGPLPIVNKGNNVPSDPPESQQLESKDIDAAMNNGLAQAIANTQNADSIVAANQSANESSPEENLIGADGEIELFQNMDLDENGRIIEIAQQIFAVRRSDDGDSVKTDETPIAMSSNPSSGDVKITESTMPSSISKSWDPKFVIESIFEPHTTYLVGGAGSMATAGNSADIGTRKYNFTFFSVDYHTIRSKCNFLKKDVLIVGCSDGLLSDPVYFVRCNKVLCLDSDYLKIIRASDRNTNSVDNFSRHNFVLIEADVRHDAVRFEADILINNFVFNRYNTKEDIDKIANFCFGYLKPGKICYVILRNSMPKTFWGDSLRKYGIKFTNREEMSNGFKTRVIKYTYLRETNCVHYCFNTNFYITALKEAGFINVEQLPLRFERLREFEPPDFWEDLKANPHQVILAAEKPLEAAVCAAKFEDL